MQAKKPLDTPGVLHSLEESGLLVAPVLGGPIVVLAVRPRAEWRFPVGVVLREERHALVGAGLGPDTILEAQQNMNARFKG